MLQLPFGDHLPYGHDRVIHCLPRNLKRISREASPRTPQSTYLSMILLKLTHLVTPLPNTRMHPPENKRQHQLATRRLTDNINRRAPPLHIVVKSARRVEGAGLLDDSRVSDTRVEGYLGGDAGGSLGEDGASGYDGDEFLGLSGLAEEGRPGLGGGYEWVRARGIEGDCEG